MDRTDEERQQLFPVRVVTEEERRATTSNLISFSTFKSHYTTATDTTVDNRSKMNAIKYQGSCGSCYAFSATAIAEASVVFAGKTNEVFSEQDVLDCYADSGGCGGGNTKNVIRNYFHTSGVVLESDCEYLGEESTCNSDTTRYYANQFQPVYLSAPLSTNADAKTFLKHVGVIGAYIYADSTVESYSSGVLSCTTSYSSVNHEVTIVGYTVIDDEDIWIIRNSWDTCWGIEGYMYLVMGSCATDIFVGDGVLFDNCFELTSESSCSTNPHCQYCSSADTCVLVTETCPECSSGDCCSEGAYRSSSYVCYTATGLCDKDVYCTGSSASCPTDIYASSSTVCRAVTDACDVAEYCTGSSASCPTDIYASASTLCRDAAGECDVAEYCTGSSASCPTDIYASSSTLCRAAASADCDVAEYCTGASADCPTDVYKTGVCDEAENDCEEDAYCSGGTCTAKTYKSTGTPCDDGDSCTTNDLCDGSGVCNGQNTECACSSDEDCEDNNVCTTEYCDADTLACVYASIEETDVLCRVAADECDYVEYCANGVCPEDLTNATCVAEHTGITESEKASFPMYAVAIIAIGTVLLVVVIMFVVHRVWKNGDELDGGEAPTTASTESNSAHQE
jgi:hypothetical protein